MDSFVTVLVVVCITLAQCSLVHSNTSSLVLNKSFHEVCRQNISLYQPFEWILINFTEPINTQLQECVTFVSWKGSLEYNLLVHTTDVSSTSISLTKVGQYVDQALNIEDYDGKMLKLNILGPRPFYLTVVPSTAVLVTAEKRLKCHSASQISCSLGCINSSFICDGIAQCDRDELLCVQAYTLKQLLTSIFEVAGFSLALAIALWLFTYCRFYRTTKQYLLSEEHKPRLYGTVNGSFHSDASSSLSCEFTDDQGKKTQFYENLQQQYQYTLKNGLFK